MNLVFLDTETTGLNPARHEVWEVAWAVDRGPIHSGRLHHSLRNAHPVVLEINRYHDRQATAWADEKQLLVDLAGATLVAANPAFDSGFLSARWGGAPWKYRMLDIETYAMPAFGWAYPKGLKDIGLNLSSEFGVVIPESNHTAAGDVAAVQAAYYALQRIYSMTAFPNDPNDY